MKEKKSTSTPIAFLVCAVVIPVCLIVCDTVNVVRIASAQTTREKNMTSNELDQRGRELRAEIERILQEVKKSNGLSTLARGLDISSSTSSYIPPGTSFEEAEIILQSAGFKLLPSPPRPNPPPGLRDEFRFEVSGELILYRDVVVELVAYANVTPQIRGELHAKTKKFSVLLRYTSL